MNIAIEKGNLEIVKLLLEVPGININMPKIHCVCKLMNQFQKKKKKNSHKVSKKKSQLITFQIQKFTKTEFNSKRYFK